MHILLEGAPTSTPMDCKKVPSTNAPRRPHKLTSLANSSLYVLTLHICCHFCLKEPLKRSAVAGRPFESQ